MKPLSFRPGQAPAAVRVLLAAALWLAASAPAQTLYYRHLNLNFGSGTNLGPAAFTGGPTNQPWNIIPGATTVASNYTYYGTSTTVPVITHDTFTNLVYATGSNAPVTVTITNLLSVGHNSAGNVMFDSFLSINAWIVVDDWNADLMEYISIPANPALALRHLPAGTYDLYLYGAGGSYYDSEGFRVKVGTNAFSPWKSTAPPDPIDVNWAENTHYVRFTNLVVATNDTVYIELAEGYSQDVVNGLQIVDLTSTNPPIPQLPAVTFDPASGATVPVNVALSVSGHGDATIYYTTDGSTPTTMSSVYSSAIALSAPATVKALATKSGYADSAVASASYIYPTAPAPSVDPASGNYHHALSVTLSSGLSGASYKYSYNGTSWSDYSGPVSVDAATTLYAKTVKAGYLDSANTVRSYTFSLTNSIIAPSDGVFTNAVSVTLSNATAGAAMQYSLDYGQTWSNYTGPFVLDGLNAGTGHIRVAASKSGYASVTNTSGLFTFIVAAPEFSHAAGSYADPITVTLASATTNAAIEYSHNQIEWLAYSTGLTFTNNVTLHARAAKAGYLTGGHARHQAGDGFSSVQGLNQWFYLYATEVGGLPDTFLPLYDNSLAIWRKAEDLACMVAAATQHAATTNDSVRTFLAPVDGTVAITGQVRLDTPEATVNGVQFRVLRNAAPVSGWQTLNGGTFAVNLNLATNLLAGENLHFQLSGFAEGTGDLVRWNPAVTYTHARTYTINDTDGDGLNDDLEVALGTDPQDADSDDDGVSDYLEWLQGRSPLIAGTVADTTGAVKLLTFTPLK